MKKYFIPFIGLFLIIAFAASFILTSPPTAQAAEPKRGGWMKIATDSTAVGLDPAIAIAFASSTYFEPCYESLLRFDKNMDMEPSLATSWEQPDDLTYIFHLRKGVKFHDGSDFTSADAKYTFERILDPKTASPRKPFFTSISKLEAPDKYTLKVIMAEPYPNFLTVVATWYASIISKAAVEKHGTLQSVVIGTGPFKLEKYEHGVKGVYKRFEDYWDAPKPYIDGYDFIVIKDETSRLAALRKGTVDVGWIKNAQLASLLSKRKNLKIMSGPAVRQQRLWFKNDRPPFNNVKVRQALASAINRQEIIDTVMFGHGVLTASIPTACVPYGLSQEEMAKLPFYKQDFELSKKLLKEAGYPDGFEFTLITSPHSPDYVPGAEIMQQQFAKIGVKMNIEAKDWGITLKAARSGKFEAIMYAGVWYPGPEAYSYNQFHSKSSANYYGHNDPKLDKMYDAQHTEVDMDKRIEMWRELQRYMAETVPCIYPYASPPRYEIVNDRVQNYSILSNNSRVLIRQAWLRK